MEHQERVGQVTAFGRSKLETIDLSYLPPASQDSPAPALGHKEPGPLQAAHRRFCLREAATTP